MALYKTKYKKKYAKMVDKYLKERQDREYEYQKTYGKAASFEEKVKARLPSQEDYANYIGVARKTLYNWANETDGKGKLLHPEFAEALEKIHSEQLKRLIDRGLEGTYNSTIVKLMLNVNHGMKEGTDITSGGKPINTFNDEQIDRIAERIRTRSGSDGDTPGS